MGSIHDGHRERLLQTIYEGDFNSLSPYQQVEALLFYIFPRGDVNPLAHRLYDHFGSFYAILDADINDLQSISGMGRMSAIKIKNLLPIFTRYTDTKIADRVAMNTTAQLMDCFERLLRTSNIEETVVIALNKSSQCVGARRIAYGDDRRVGLEIKKLYTFIDTYRANSIIIAHNHPGGKCSPSKNDIPTFNQLLTVVETYGCRLIDSFIVGIDGIYSLNEARIKKSFNEPITESVLSIMGNDANNYLKFK